MMQLLVGASRLAGILDWLWLPLAAFSPVIFVITLVTCSVKNCSTPRSVLLAMLAATGVCVAAFACYVLSMTLVPYG